MKMNEDFVYQILSIVDEIPKGFVVTYGQLAVLSGNDKNARLVGKILSMAQFYGEYPCHRVVNSSGRCVPGWQEQKELLLEEGVTFKLNGCVNLKTNQWKIK